MSEQVRETTIDGKGFFGKVGGLVEDAVVAGVQVERLKTTAKHAVNDGITDAKRLLKKGEYAAEDLLEDTTHMIKHDPWSSVGISLGVGFGMGILAGWFLTHQTSKNNR